MEPIHSNVGTRHNQGLGGSTTHERSSTSSLTDQGKNLMEQGKEKASDLIDQAKSKASDAIDTVKQGYSQLGDRLHEGGEYVRERTGEGVDQLTTLIRHNPTSAVLVSFCAGFFLCRMLKD